AQDVPCRIDAATVGPGLFPRRNERRRCDRQGYQAIRGYRWMGILQLQSSRAEGTDRQGEGVGGMRVLPYRQRQEGPSVDAILSRAGLLIRDICQRRDRK